MKNIIWKTILIAISVLILIALCIIRYTPEWAEFYVRYLTSNYVKIVGTITQHLPISLYELTLVILVVLACVFITTIIIRLCKKKYKRALQRSLSLVLTILICVNVYTSTASIAYGRKEVPIPQYDEGTHELLNECYPYFLEDYNNISKKFDRNEDSTIISPYTFDETCHIISQEYKRLDDPYFSDFTPHAKQLISSDIFTSLQLSGVFFAPFGESNINSNLFATELPFVIAHELAHGKGVMRENDANLVAAYILLTSDNYYLRYSGYYATFGKLFFDHLAINPEYKDEIYQEINRDILKENTVIANFWSSHDLLSEFGEWFNNLYLILNGNKNGTDDYIDSSTSEDRGETNDNGYQIPTYIEYSPYEKLYFYLYINR